MIPDPQQALIDLRAHKLLSRWSWRDAQTLALSLDPDWPIRGRRAWMEAHARAERLLTDPQIVARVQVILAALADPEFIAEFGPVRGVADLPPWPLLTDRQKQLVMKVLNLEEN